MSCCGYHQLKWYYTYPSNPYKYVEVQRPKPITIEFRDASGSNMSPSIEPYHNPGVPHPASLYDLNMGWFNPPVSKRLD